MRAFVFLNNHLFSMNLLKYLLLAIVVIFTTFSVWMAFLPESFNVSKTIEIQAPRDSVFEIITDLNRFQEWAAWFEGGSVNVRVSNPSSGKGAWVAFQDDQGTSGKLIFSNFQEPREVTYQLEYNNKVEAIGRWLFEDAEGQTAFSWQFEGSMPYYFRWVNLTMERRMGADLLRNMNRADSLYFRHAD
jgi:uncharacterized protein YndB with AHSA1/START domain